MIFVGLQGAGKSTFYKERFFDTHLRISLDMLKTRYRERRFLTRRNERRLADHQVPFRGILGTAGRMELPSLKEGFDELHYVRIEEGGGFVVEGWQDEV